MDWHYGWPLEWFGTVIPPPAISPEPGFYSAATSREHVSSESQSTCVFLRQLTPGLLHSGTGRGNQRPCTGFLTRHRLFAHRLERSRSGRCLPHSQVCQHRERRCLRFSVQPRWTAEPATITSRRPQRHAAAAAAAGDEVAAGHEARLHGVVVGLGPSEGVAQGLVAAGAAAGCQHLQQSGLVRR